MPALDEVARRVLGPAYNPVKLQWSTLQGWRTWRRADGREPVESIWRALGGLVQRGPFAGLRYPRHLVPFAPRLTGKLLAQYEKELAPVFTDLLDEGFDVFVDVGSSEGFYAVGFALKSPGTRVAAFDVDPLSRRLCRWLASANGVADRVTTGGFCTHDDLQRLAGGRKACVLSDCEGGEMELLDPDLAPVLKRCTIVVELHEDILPGVTERVLDRFRDSHEITLIDSEPRNAQDVRAILDGRLSDEELEPLLFERPYPMQWGVLKPRAG